MISAAYGPPPTTEADGGVIVVVVLVARRLMRFVVVVVVVGVREGAVALGPVGADGAAFSLAFFPATSALSALALSCRDGGAGASLGPK